MKNRNINLDLIRSIAIFFVIAVHFLLNTGFYTLTIASKKITIMYFLRVLLITCVPLFLLLTGYLMNKKELNKKYYKGILKTVGIYIIISILCIIFRNIYYKESIGFFQGIKKILDFSADSYAWYIEMYIGLFLLIPFFNIIINNIKNKKHYEILLGTLILLTVLPTLSNIFNLESFAQFISSNVYSNTKILSNYWLGLWPITYYFVGAYINRYDINLNKKEIFTLLIIFFGLFCYFNYFRNINLPYVETLYFQYFGFQAFIISILIFLFITKINLKNSNNIIKKVIIKISNLSLGIYLSSIIIDSIVYDILNEKVIEVANRIYYFIPVVIIVFILSTILSQIANTIYDLLLKLIKKIWLKISKFKLKKIKIKTSVLFWILLIFIILFYAWRIPYGSGGWDESFYLTISHRIRMGDALLSEEWHLSQMTSFIIYPLIKLYLTFFKTESILLNFRAIFVIFKLLISIILFYLLNKKNKYISIPISLLFLLFNPYNILQFCYNNLAYIFVFVISIIILTKDLKNKKIVLILGGLYSLSILCCPYLIVIYILLTLGFFISLIKKNKCYIDFYRYFTLSCVLVAIIFIIFILSRTSVKSVLDNIPCMFLDPEHSVGGKIDIIKNILFVHINYIPKLFYGTVMLFILITVDALINRRKSKLLGRKIYPIISLIIFIIAESELLISIEYNYNFIMIPLAYTGFNCIYILLLEGVKNKDFNKCCLIWIFGFMYSLCLIFSSNQLFFVYSIGMAISSMISIYILYIVFKTIYIKKDIYYFIFKIMIILILLIQLGGQVYSLFTYSYNSGKIIDVNSKITQGPLKGIIVKPEEKKVYDNVMKDLKILNTMENANFIYYGLKPYAYLYVDKIYAVHSAWSGNIDAQIELNRLYYKLHKDKKPKYIYIEKSNEAKTKEILKIYDIKYKKYELENGVLYIES